MHRFVCIFVLAATACFGSSHGVSNATSITVTSSQHGCTSAAIGARFVTSAGVQVLNYTFSVNASTFAATATWTTSQSGTLHLLCGMPTAATSNPFAKSSSTTEVTVGAGASLTDVQRLNAGGKGYVTTNPVTYHKNTNAARTVYVYLADKLTFCESESTPVGYISAHAGEHVQVIGGCGAGWPNAGEVKLYQFSVLGAAGFGDWYDFR